MVGIMINYKSHQNNLQVGHICDGKGAVLPVDNQGNNNTGT